MALKSLIINSTVLKMITGLSPVVGYMRQYPNTVMKHRPQLLTGPKVSNSNGMKWWLYVIAVLFLTVYVQRILNVMESDDETSLVMIVQ